MHIYRGNDLVLEVVKYLIIVSAYLSPYLGGDGVQHMLPQNMALWHIDY